MPTALFVSPHLDDVAFSCGGLAACMADSGWHTVLVTVFTRTVMPATGFALACQLDKGLSPDIDYMALRRSEDVEAAAILGFRETHWLDLPEAPHRGYGSADALFGDVASEDTIATALSAALLPVISASQPEIILVPQALGHHVDHQVVVAAAQHIASPDRLAYYRDLPYAIRVPNAAPAAQIPDLPLVVVPITAAMERKIAAAQAYASQVGFQFNGVDALAASLLAFATREGNGTPAERFIAPPHALAAFATVTAP